MGQICPVRLKVLAARALQLSHPTRAGARLPTDLQSLWELGFRADV